MNGDGSGDVATAKANGVRAAISLASALAPLGSVVVVIIAGTFWISAVNGTAKNALDLASQNQIRLNDAQRQIADYKTALVALRTQLAEVETQFCDGDIVRNLMHAHDMRLQAMLWQKTFPGSTLPTDNAFYPTICNRDIR
jgi:hypothetical protein